MDDFETDLDKLEMKADIDALKSDVDMMYRAQAKRELTDYANELQEENKPTPKEDMIDFFMGLTTEETKAMDKYVQANKSHSVNVEELRGALSAFRVYQNEKRTEAPKLSPQERLRNATTPAEKELILEELGLYKNPKKHFYEGAKAGSEATKGNIDYYDPSWRNIKDEIGYGGKANERYQAMLTKQKPAQMKDMPTNWKRSLNSNDLSSNY